MGTEEKESSHLPDSGSRMKTLEQRMRERSPLSAEVWREGFGTHKTSCGIDPIVFKDASIVAETELAVLARHASFGVDPQWIPRSQLFPESISVSGRFGRLIVSGWLAEKNGWVP